MMSQMLKSSKVFLPESSKFLNPSVCVSDKDDERNPRNFLTHIEYDLNEKVTKIEIVYDTSDHNISWVVPISDLRLTYQEI